MEEAGLGSIKEKKRCYGDELLVWGSTKTDPNVEEIKSLQKWIEGLIAEDVTPENRAEPDQEVGP